MRMRICVVYIPAIDVKFPKNNLRNLEKYNLKIIYFVNVTIQNGSAFLII